MKKLVVILTLSLFMFLHTVVSLKADSTVFTENFSQDFSQWQPTRDNGELWKIIDGQAEVFIDTAYTITELVPKDEFWSKDWGNLSYELDYTPLAGVDKNITFGFQNLTHWYEIHFVQDFFNLVKVKNGTQPFDVNLPFVMQNGQTYHLQILFHTGLIEVFVNQQLIAQEYDWTFQADYGKIGIKVSTGASYPTHVRLDNIVVKQILGDGFKLEVPLVEQNHPLWSDEVYDTAEEWSTEPTIGRWGCALTSMVMILKYYGLTTFPDNQEITPSSLNNWLISQADGYLGEGLVNWLAITRLTQIISQKYQTPKLEFEIIIDKAWKTAVSELQLAHPVILNMPGHFMTAIGLTGNKQDFYINDPFFNNITFLQHQQPLESIRKFTPSHTDLSYIVIAHSPAIDLKITQDGQMPKNLTTVTEFLKNTETGESNQPHVLEYLTKPTSGDYEVLITPATSQTEPQQIKLDIFAYDQAGNLSDLSWEGPIDTQPLLFAISFQKESTSTITAHITWEKFHQSLINLTTRREVKRLSSYAKLRQVIDLASTATVPNQQRYILLLEHRLKSLGHTMSPFAQTFLLSRLEMLKNYLNSL